MPRELILATLLVKEDFTVIHVTTDTWIHYKSIDIILWPSDFSDTIHY